MDLFLSGALFAFSLVAAMQFFRAWRQTGDRLFMMFGLAFWLLSLERVLLAMHRLQGEDRPAIYLVRLFAFLLISFAILQKNLNGEPKS
jgi:hypothetical protein